MSATKGIIKVIHVVSLPSIIHHNMVTIGNKTKGVRSLRVSDQIRQRHSEIYMYL
jgi:hypothetical protein